MSAARPMYGVAGVAAASEQPRQASPLLPLLLLFVVLAAATAWYVAVPAFAKQPPRGQRVCEVIVLEAGATKCVQTPASRAAAHKPKRVKH